MSDPIDLTGFPYMPLYIERLQKSKAWLICRRRPELAFYFLNLWMHAWHEVPAGSLEDDDDVLADAARCDLSRWPKLKDDILRGWEKGPDGRLYHRVVVAFAEEAFAERLAHRAKTAAGRAAKEAKRREKLGLPPLPASVTASVTETETGDGSAARGAATDPPTEGESGAGASVTALKGREGKGRLSDSSSSSGAEPGTAAEDLPPLDPANAIIAEFDCSRAEVFGREQGRPWPNHLDRPVAEQWIALGADLAFARAVFDAVNLRLKARGHEPRKMLKGMDEEMRAALGMRAAGPPGVLVPIRPMSGGTGVDAGALEVELARLNKLEEGAA